MRASAKSNARRIVATVQRVEGQPYPFSATRRQPRLSGGEGPNTYYCVLSTNLGAATGTFPSVSPTSESGVTIYRSVPISLVALSGTHVVWNWWPIAWVSGKMLRVSRNGSGGFDVDNQVC